MIMGDEKSNCMGKENVIMDLSFKFALEIIQYCESLEARKRYVISQQLLKSGTSIGANIRESQQSESKPDFIHKMKIAAKEADETEYWLLMCKNSESYTSPVELLEQIITLKKLLSKIISSSKKSLKPHQSNQPII